MTLGTQLVILVTILALLVYLWTGLRVAAARAKFGVKAPATTGNADFERVLRVQYNTLEQIVLFLPSLWLFHMMVGNIWGGVIGLVWPAGRVIYALSYYRAAEQRGLGFLLTIVPSLILLTGALAGLILIHFRGY